jgi:hypothetical protein
MVCSAVSEERVCNSCALCISHTIWHGTTQPSIHLRLVQGIQAERVHLQKTRVLVGPLSDATVDRVRTCFQHSSQKSTSRASRELQLPQTTVSKILRKRLLMKPYKLQLVQALKPEDLADYRLDICRVTRGAHIEYLWGGKNFFSIDWCRCEVLSTPHLFSVLFWKCKALLCSPCT